MRNCFLKNHTQSVVGKLFPDPFLKNQKILFLLFAKLRTIEKFKYLRTKTAFKIK